MRGKCFPFQCFIDTLDVLNKWLFFMEEEEKEEEKGLGGGDTPFPSFLVFAMVRRHF